MLAQRADLFPREPGQLQYQFGSGCSLELDKLNARYFIMVAPVLDPVPGRRMRGAFGGAMITALRRIHYAKARDRGNVAYYALGDGPPALIVLSPVAGEAAAGETLVSDIVRGLAKTSAGVSFDDRGEREQKGVGEQVRVFAEREQS